MKPFTFNKKNFLNTMQDVALDNKINDSKLTALGFNLVKGYPHDAYYTERYKLNHLEVEVTFLDLEVVSIDLTITEINAMPIDLEKLTKITNLLGQTK